MSADFMYQGCVRANQSLLQDLHDRFASHHKDMQTYGLPKPQTLLSELQREQFLIGDGSLYSEQLHQLHIDAPNTDEMTEAYRVITNSIVNGETKFFLIRGCGGAGKTQFAKKVRVTYFTNL